jgi:hypothetical protein
LKKKINGKKDVDGGENKSEMEKNDFKTGFFT